MPRLDGVVIAVALCASVPLAEALSSYISTVLRHRRDEATIMGPPTETTTLPIITADTVAEDTDDDEEAGDWRLFTNEGVVG